MSNFTSPCVATIAMTAWVVGSQPEAPPPALLTKAEVETRVRAHAAKQRHVEPAAVVLVHTEARVWPDRWLGCGVARKGVEERPAAVEGYVVTVSVDGESLVYHADRTGRIVRCSPVKKGLDRIAKVGSRGARDATAE
jgi:hypothetical protein